MLSNTFLMTAVSTKYLLQTNKDDAPVFPQDAILLDGELYVVFAGILGGGAVGFYLYVVNAAEAGM